MSQRWDEKGVEIDGEIAEDKYKYNEYKQHAAKRKYTLQAHCCYDSVGTWAGRNTWGTWVPINLCFELKVPNQVQVPDQLGLDGLQQKTKSEKRKARIVIYVVD